MAFRLAVLLAALSCASAVPILGAPVVAGGYGYPGYGYAGYPRLAAPALVPKVAVAAPAEYDPNPQYSYNYHVDDALTGDSKAQQETRSGDVVQGSYTLIEPDGNRRTVEYTADPIHGFNAVVHREPAVVAKAVVPAVAKAVLPGVAPYGYPRPYGYPALAAPGLVGGHLYG